MPAALVNSAVASIPVRNAWYLLLYAWDMARLGERWRAASERSPSLLGLLARILAEATRELLRRQLGRVHTTHREAIRGIKGRIDFAQSLKRRTFQRGAAHCVFADLGVDSLKNRILLATLHRLASDPRVTHPQSETEADLRHELQSLVRAMDNVSLVPISSADFSRLQLGRNDREYALPIAICALVRRLEVLTEDAGENVLAALMRDEITFHRLFEKFVRNFYRLHLKDHRVKAEDLDWHDDLAGGLVPAMRTDTTIVEKLPPYRRLIIDTKYSITTLASSQHGSAKFKAENLYQIYAYLRTQEHLSPSHRCAEGMLLYPTTGGDCNEVMSVQGHRIRVATVDLSKSWESIEARLLALVP